MTGSAPPASGVTAAARAAPTGDAVEAVYRERAARFARERDACTARWNRVANLRLLVFVVAVACAAVGVWRRAPLFAFPAALCLGGFIALVVYHNLLGRRRRRYAELWALNEEACRRLARDWDALPLRHPDRADAAHPYAADLDIAGRASLLHLLDPGSTRLGAATLRDWLLAPAPPDAVRARQPAVAELAPLLDLRQQLALQARLGDEPDPAPFLAWAEGAPWLARRRGLLWAARGGAALFWALLLGQAAGLVPYPLWVLVALANAMLSLTAGRPVYRAVTAATSSAGALQHYAAALRLLAGADVRAPTLAALRADLAAGGEAAPRALRRLHRLATLAVPASSLVYLVLQAATLWDVHLLAALERWQIAAGGRARRWLVALGEAEALAALAGLAHDNPGWAFPEIAPGADVLAARGLGHPYLPARVRVVNDVAVGPPGTFLLVTGSNMSGKSTLLRAIGVNIVLAQAGGPVCAVALSLPPLALWTSMRVEDSLERGVSYFMAELQRLKRVVDAAGSARSAEGPRLCYVLDEILQGTNTAERQIAARRIILHLVAAGAIGAVSTHDLTLAADPAVAAAAHPVHFTETIADGAGGPAMTFDYTLRPGLATSTNALRLMELVGLPSAEDPAG
ncbi:MAG TPA: hypothetical protein VFL91_15075 [Thermomicrobiales bacterium]|nr:hypothetical protein [Thermomicrobiales bacterium]